MKKPLILLGGGLVLIIIGAIALIVIPAPQKAIAPTIGTSTEP